ncbi:hypothetical protein Tco_0205684 [Tanacetum coccineum]
MDKILLKDSHLRTLHLVIQTKENGPKITNENAMVSSIIERRTNHIDYQKLLNFCFLFKKEQDGDSKLWKIPSWVVGYAKSGALLQFNFKGLDSGLVDDIIFGSTKKSLCDEFEGLMHKRFQDEFYWRKLRLSLLGFTPIETNKALVKDEEAEAVDVHLYRSMIEIFDVLTASRHEHMCTVWLVHRKSTKEVVNFPWQDSLISWPIAKKLDYVANFSVAEYVDAANCVDRGYGISKSNA